MRNISLALLIILQLVKVASGSEKREVADSVQSRLDTVRSILYAVEWEPVDSLFFVKMNELVEYIENSPVDSLVVQLDEMIDTNQVFFTRDISWVAEAENIDGYVHAMEINNTLINIERHAEEDMPLDNIVVPEDEFVGMLSKLPIIMAEEKEKLINDSLIAIPDSILLSIAEARLSNSERKHRIAEEIKDKFLEEERVKYNDQLIQTYRDSVIQSYRENVFNNYVSRLKKEYTESVAIHNQKVLTEYNDSVSRLVNQQYRDNFRELVRYVNHLPYDLKVYNYFDQPSHLTLQNGADWFQWVWLKNAQNDSIGIRFESLDKHSVKAFVDESVNLSRINTKQTVGLENLLLENKVEQKLKKVKNRTPELSPWKLEGKVYSGFTQTYINDYWSKGGKSSASALSTFGYDANYSKGKLKWESGVDAKLGLIYYIPDEESTALRNWHKNSDNFEINSRFGYSAFKEWYYSAEANFKTQFFLGFKDNNQETPNSSLLSPAYLTFSGGFDYKPNNKFSMFLAPLSVKTTYVLNPEVDETKFGLEEGLKRKSRIGMNGKFEYSNKITEDIAIRSKNSVFVNYGKNNAGELQLFKIPDFDSETTINFKVNQFISTQLNFHFIYDKDVESKWTDDAGVEQTGTKLQVKEFFTLGVSYKFR